MVIGSLVVIVVVIDSVSATITTTITITIRSRNEQPPSHYLHGTAPPEQRRLSRLNELLSDASLRELVLKGGERVSGTRASGWIGCGLAQLTRAMARACGERVPGIDRGPAQLAEAVRQAREAGEEALLDLREGDALQLPLAQAGWSGFDVAHTRFLLERVPDPAAVVRQMVRAVRPGGRIVLEDDAHDSMPLAGITRFRAALERLHAHL